MWRNVSSMDGFKSKPRVLKMLLLCGHTAFFFFQKRFPISSTKSFQTYLWCFLVLWFRAGMWSPSRTVVWGPSHHLLTPLSVTGLLETPSCGLYGQGTGSDSSQQTAATVHRQSQVHRRLQHHLEERSRDGQILLGHTFNSLVRFK